MKFGTRRGGVDLGGAGSIAVYMIAIYCKTSRIID